MIKAPRIKINGKEIVAKEPKIKIWKKLTKLQQAESELNSDEGIDTLIDFLADVFDVDSATIENNVGLGDFFGIFQEVGEWIGKIVTEKSEKISKN